MKFVDEATIRVQAGNGGHGCLSFRREKYVERGGPDGGDGGHGGSVYLVADPSLNTLADFRVARKFKAEGGTGGSGRNKTGRSGDDLDVLVPFAAAREHHRLVPQSELVTLDANHTAIQLLKLDDNLDCISLSRTTNTGAVDPLSALADLAERNGLWLHTDAAYGGYFVLADDLGYGDLQCYGNPYVETPVINELANEGILFTSHYSPSPLCAPARAGYLTGRYNHRTGAIDVSSNRGIDRIEQPVQPGPDFRLCHRQRLSGVPGGHHPPHQ